MMERGILQMEFVSTDLESNHDELIERARNDFLAINANDEEWMDAVITWYLKYFGEVGL